MYKGYKVRLFPTPEQEELLWKHIHACRFIWNYMLAYQEENYQNGGVFIGKYDMNRMVSKMRQMDEYKWLQGISIGSLQNINGEVELAYKRFFKNGWGHPKFRSRKEDRKSYPLRLGKVYFKDKYVSLPSIGKMNYQSNFIFPKGTGVKFVKPYVSIVNDKWILSFSLEFENQGQKLNDYKMGIDLGIKELAVIAVNNQKLVFHNINKSKRIKTLEHKLKHIQRVINRKYRTNGNYEKTNAILKYEKMQREIYYKIANIRKNYIHQITNKLINMYPKRITMEQLDINYMMKNKHLSLAIQNQCWHEFIRQMKYKCEWAGIEFIQADRFYPSSKTCSQCGEIKKDLKLSDRVYKCSCCGLEIDRDYNAAINLMNYSCPTE